MPRSSSDSAHSARAADTRSIDRLRAALDAELVAAGRGGYAGPSDAESLRRACLAAVLDTYDAGGEPHREITRVVVRYLLELLAAAAPGHAVEVRVPPHAAIQCLEGPRHSRGTPPNVVEADAPAWVALATGRLGWDDAVRTGRVTASGARSDIGDQLPVIDA